MTVVVSFDIARAVVIEALASVEGREIFEVEAAIAAAGGDGSLQLDSKQAEVMIAFAEERFGRELPSPADLPKDRFSTIAALVELVAPAVVVPAKV